MSDEKSCKECKDYDDGYDIGHNDGYNQGYNDARTKQKDEILELIEKLRKKRCQCKRCVKNDLCFICLFSSELKSKIEEME